MRGVLAALVGLAAMVSPAAASSSDIDPLTLTCADYSATDKALGVRLISADQRQNIVMFAFGYAMGQAGQTKATIDDKTVYGADLIDVGCALPEYAKGTVLDLIKHLTLTDVDVVIEGQPGGDAGRRNPFRAGD
jgi:hypothetical protein